MVKDMPPRDSQAKPSDKELIRQARQAQRNAYAPYSDFPVGAALMTEDGRVFAGCNVENASFGATSCAERNAAFMAVCKGSKRFIKIVVVTNQDEPVMPCGICRQVLWEFGKNMEIIAVGKTGREIRVQLADLQPYGFDLEEIKPASKKDLIE